MATLALDLGGTKIAAALVDGATLRHRQQVPTPASAGPEAVIASLLALTERVRTDANEPIERVAIATTGQVLEGRVWAVNRATMPGWEGIPIAARLQTVLGCPVTLVNDAHAAAWGEHRYGAGSGCHDFLFVTVSTGIGAGVVIAEQLARGARGLAGHLGFWAVGNPPSPSILEARASGSAIARAASAVTGEAISSEAAFAGAHHDARLARVIDEAVAELAGALVQVRWLLDPSRIAIGGSVGLATGYLERLQEATARLAPAASPMPLLRAALGADAGLLGAAALAHIDP